MTAAIARLQAARRGFAVRLLWVLLVVVAGVLAVAPSASAHVLPSSSVQLDVAESSIAATVTIPLDDLENASGIQLAEQTQAAVDENAEAITAYLLEHFAPTSDDGTAWAVDAGDLTVSDAGDTSTTGIYQQLTTTFELTPPAGGDVRSFDLGYDAVVEREITHVVLVTVASDADSDTAGAYELGTIRLDTVTGTVGSLHVDLGAGSEAGGFASMLVLGMQHILDGTDHQLFLLTLLLPAPLLAVRRRWRDTVPLRRAVQRIVGVTAAFTVGHSVTLALGALGLPVPIGLIEALIAVSILVAAVHAIRPVFAGREVVIAGAFGLIHGLAFSETLRELDLTGSRLVLALLGFNLGIEAMQLLIVVAVLPPLVILARARRCTALRIVAAALTAVAAVGWLGARLGVANPIADAADSIGTIALLLVAALWIAALTVLLASRRLVGPVPSETGPGVDHGAMPPEKHLLLSPLDAEDPVRAR